MKNGAFSRSSVEADVFGHLGFALDRRQQQQEFVAADPRQHVGFAQVQRDPPGHFDQQRVADGVAVIVVDMLEVVDVEEGQREAELRLALQDAAGAMLDHPPRRQAGQFVIIGRAEQMVLDRLLRADIGRTRQQEIAARDANRPMRRQQHLSGCAVAEDFLRRRRASLAQQFEAGLAALDELLRIGPPVFGAEAELARRDVVDQQEMPLLVLDRDAGRQHSQHIAQKAKPDIVGEGAFAFHGIDRQVVGSAALHDRRL